MLLVGLSCMFIFTKFSDKFLRKIELEKDKIDRILKSTPNAIIIHKDDKILYANKSAFHLFNVDESFDINSVSISDIVHKDFAEISKQMIANVVDKNLHAKTANLKIVCFDGVIKDIESTAIPFDFNGEKSVLVIAKDITQLLFLENQLKHSEEQFRLIFESSPLAISVTSINDGKYSAVNKVFEKISGYSRDEIIGKTSTELGFWLTEQERNNFVKTLVENKFIDESEIKFKVRNGNKIYCLVTSRLIKIASENYILSLIEDITNKKYLQDISKKEDLRAKILFEIYSKASELNEKDFFSLVIDKAVELTDSKIGFFHKVNDDQGTIELVTWSLELRQNCSPVFDSHYPISQAGNWVDCIKKGETLTYNDYDKLPNKKGFPEGHVGLTRFMSVPAFLNGKVKLIFGVGNKDAEYNEFDEKNLGIIANELTKILEKKTLNEALKKSENELRGLFNANSTYIIKTDMEGKYTFYNQKFKKTFDWLFNGNDFYGINSLETIYHEDHPKCLEVVERCIQNPETTFQVELRKPKQGDKQMTTLWEFTCKLGSNNQPEEMLCVGLDITEKKNAELKLDEYRKNLERMVEERTEELKRTNQGLETQIEKEKELKAQLAEALSKEKELNELKTRFVASVSHEFRTPLAALLSSSQIIQKYSQKWNEEKLNVHYQKIENMVNHLTQLLDEVITISRADREVIKNIPSKEVIDQVINSIIQIEKQNLKKGQKIIYKNECDKEIYSIDIKLFDHILSNLLSNASKYSPEVSKIILSVQSDAGNLIIKVKDEGIGIPADEIKNIYEPFYRNENSIGFKGSGLGLNIVKRCIDILNGKIEVESEINKGTIFSVLIPVE
ncbi:MAG: hypothetical protein CO129_01485 [Ignavibacteriales bacterium CG_4_9_14_3_um_filter_34_10]|nr:MAG: hypothetical protein CO129_01485 [Ignavibacteriales bacterium CG_4_9_14_3_um_filter_34_10]